MAAAPEDETACPRCGGSEFVLERAAYDPEAAAAGGVFGGAAGFIAGGMSGGRLEARCARCGAPWPVQPEGGPAGAPPHPVRTRGFAWLVLIFGATFLLVGAAGGSVPGALAGVGAVALGVWLLRRGRA